MCFNEFRFTLISSEDKEQETLLLISQSPCALSTGTAWEVLLQHKRCNVMATTLWRSRDRPGCELRTLVNSALFCSHWGRCLFPVPQRVGFHSFMKKITWDSETSCRADEIPLNGQLGALVFTLNPFQGLRVISYTTPMLPPPYWTYNHRASSRCQAPCWALWVPLANTDVHDQCLKEDISSGTGDSWAGNMPVVAAPRWVRAWGLQITLLWPPPAAVGARQHHGHRHRRLLNSLIHMHFTLFFLHTAKENVSSGSFHVK